MANFPEINLRDYLYHLPAELVAKRPVGTRDASRLLVYDQGKITHNSFGDIAGFLPAASTLFFNDAKVIPARIPFRRMSGARIEVFLLQPVSHNGEVELAMKETSRCCWDCMIGNAKRWQEGESIRLNVIEDQYNLVATLLSKQEKKVEFRWDSGHSFSEIIEKVGKIPLPPYMHRDAEASDYVRYQTVYATHAGAVAAPTAGLHFTQEILDELKHNGHSLEYLTLHVGAGTFQPISTDRIEEHVMHNERMVVSRQQIEALLDATNRIAIGTTSVRTIESLYWFGVRLQSQPDAQFCISKDDPYNLQKIPAENSLQNIRSYMDRTGLMNLVGSTEIFIVPGYQFQLVDALVTNFHLPESTLILLIAAFIGDDWKDVYKEAIERSYRFLSYGDSSFLIPRQLLVSN